MIEHKPLTAEDVSDLSAIANGTRRVDSALVLRAIASIEARDREIDRLRAICEAEGVETVAPVPPGQFLEMKRERDELRTRAEQTERTIADVDDALGNGADEALWPPRLTRGEAVARLVQTECTSIGPEHCGQYSWCEGCYAAELTSKRDAALAALANVSGALVDSGVEVPSDPSMYGLAVRVLTLDRDRWMDRATTIQAECDEALEKNAIVSKRCSVLTDERDAARSLLQPYQHALPIAREERDRLEATLEAVREIASEMAYFGEGTPSLVERLRALVLSETTTTPTPAPEED